MEEAKSTGYVYICTNPSFREDWVKIGKSGRDLEKRIKELNNTSVPLPFELYASLQTSKYAMVEKKVHNQIDRLTNLRISPNREFFNLSPEEALAILKDIADLIDDAVITLYKDNRAISTSNSEETPLPIVDKPSERKEAFRFSMAGIKVGEYVTFIPLGLSVRVISDNKVEYQGENYTLSGFTVKFIPDDKRNKSNAYQGALFFTYQGKVLAQLRKELEANDKPQKNSTLVSEESD